MKRARRRFSPFWLGILFGLMITCVFFYRQTLDLIRDAIGNVLPIFFTPGLLELSLGLIGIAIVIVINFFLRSEQRDEWVYIEEGESDPNEEVK